VLDPWQVLRIIVSSIRRERAGNYDDFVEQSGSPRPRHQSIDAQRTTWQKGFGAMASDRLRYMESAGGNRDQRVVPCVGRPQVPILFKITQAVANGHKHFA